MFVKNVGSDQAFWEQMNAKEDGQIKMKSLGTRIIKGQLCAESIDLQRADNMSKFAQRRGGSVMDKFRGGQEDEEDFGGGQGNAKGSKGKGKGKSSSKGNGSTGTSTQSHYSGLQVRYGKPGDEGRSHGERISAWDKLQDKKGSSTDSDGGDEPTQTESKKVKYVRSDTRGADTFSGQYGHDPWKKIANKIARDEGEYVKKKKKKKRRRDSSSSGTGRHRSSGEEDSKSKSKSRSRSPISEKPITKRSPTPEKTKERVDDRNPKRRSESRGRRRRSRSRNDLRDNRRRGRRKDSRDNRRRY